MTLGFNDNLDLQGKQEKSMLFGNTFSEATK